MFPILIFGSTFWLGLYLINRHPGDRRVRYAGLGLAAYALAWAVALFQPEPGAGGWAVSLVRGQGMLQVLPALCWMGVLIDLLPADLPLRPRLLALWRWGGWPLAALALLVGSGTDLVWVGDTVPLHPGPAYGPLALVVLLPLGALAGLLWFQWGRFPTPRPPALLLTITLFFLLSMGLLLFPLAWIPGDWWRVLAGSDLVALGITVVALDALDQGETLLPDVLRSLDYALLSAGLFGAQVALVMVFATGDTVAMRILLLAVIATAIAVPVFAGRIQALVDALAFSRWPRLRRARADLRTVEDALPRRHPEVDLATLPDAEFVRLTRRALSQFGDLARLAGSPLTYLPAIDARLAERGAPDNVLERTAELKALLAASIARLKPRQAAAFGTAEEWRHYNALYWPYVVGLKPYSKRAEGRPPDPAAQTALAWLRSQVPERTLYNWQTAAARLVAQDLRSTDHRRAA